MRQIDADALKSFMRAIPDISGLGSEPVIAMRDVFEMIDLVPAVDAIPVEWLERRRDMYMNTVTAGNLRLVADIDGLIRDWKQEREATKG